MSAEATGWVWRNSPHTGATLLVHLAIADVVNDANGWECWLTVEAIAAKARVGRSSTVTALTALVDLGLLTVAERGGGRGRPTRYVFEMPKQTGRISAGSQTGKPRDKPRDLHGETARSDAHVMTTEGTEITKRKPRDQRTVREKADPACTSCHGRGITYSATAGADVACRCVVDPEYVRAPAKATRPVVGFGMPANRRKSG